MIFESLLPEVEKLSVAERLELIDKIWDSLPPTLEAAEVPDWHIAILEKRLADANANPGDGIPWRDVMDELKARR